MDYSIHSDFTEINIISGSPKPGKMSGFVVDGLIHTVGLDPGLLMHEGVHLYFLTALNTETNSLMKGYPAFLDYTFTLIKKIPIANYCLTT